jgi:hypothetical protein
MAESRKVELYAEQDKITQALRHFSEPPAADYPARESVRIMRRFVR